MDEYNYVITFGSELGVSKQIRITDANPDLTIDDIDGPINDMLLTSIFDRTKIGALVQIKSLTREKVKHTVYDLITD